METAEDEDSTYRYVSSSHSDYSDDPDDEDYLEQTHRPEKSSKAKNEVTVHEISREPHLTSRLFEMIIMRKHATLSTCLQRLYLNITSHQRNSTIADILSFICECAGFKHSCISTELISRHDPPENGSSNSTVSEPSSLELPLSTQKKAPGKDKSTEKKGGTVKKKPKSTGNNTEGWIPASELALGINHVSSELLQFSDTDIELDQSGAKKQKKPVSKTVISVTPTQSDPDICHANFDWGYFRRMFTSLPTEALVTEILEECKTSKDYYDMDPDDTIFFPDLKALMANKRTQCLSTRFMDLCSERIKKINAALNAQDGWTIGFGKRNRGYQRFREFFQQFVMEAEPIHLGEVLHVAQWMLALSLCGFRAVRQFSHIACVELINSLLVKLETFTKNTRVFSKQLQVELELDQRTQERMHGKNKTDALKVSKASLELYKKLLLSQRVQLGTIRFIKCIYQVNFVSKLTDVLPDVRVAAAFALSNCVLLNPRIFSAEPYHSFVYQMLPTMDEFTRLLLLRYICLSETRISPENFGILLSLHESSNITGMSDCCAAIELLLLKDVNQNETGSIVHTHRKEPRFHRMIETLVHGPNTNLSVLIASVFLLSLPIRDFSVALQMNIDSLPPKYRNILIAHPVVAGKQNTLTISDKDEPDRPKFSKIFSEIYNMMKGIKQQHEFLKNLIHSLWVYTDVFRDIGELLQLLCEGGEIASSNSRLDEQQQALLLKIANASLEKLINESTETNQELQNKVESVLSFAPMMLRLYQANRESTNLVLQMIEMATQLLPKLKLNNLGAIISALTETIKQLLETEGNYDTSIICVHAALRCLYNCYNISPEAQTYIRELFSKTISELKEQQDPSRLHCFLLLLHYFPLELERRSQVMELINDNLQNGTTPEAKIWVAIGNVLYEAEVYKCVKTKKTVKPEFMSFATQLLVSLASQAHGSEDQCTLFISFSSIVSIVQISSLVGGLDQIPEQVDHEMFNILRHFLTLLVNENSRKPDDSGKTRISSRFNKESLTISDLYIAGCYNVPFDLSPPEAAICLIRSFTKILLPQLYCSGTSVLVASQLLSTQESIAKAAGFYVKFLMNFDNQILGAVFLFTMLKIYNSGDHEGLLNLVKNFVQQILDKKDSMLVDPKKLNIDYLIVSGVQLGLQCPRNHKLISYITELVTRFTSSGGAVNTALLHAHIGKIFALNEPRDEERQKVCEILHVIGMNTDDLFRDLSGTDMEQNGVERCLNVIKRLADYVELAAAKQETTKRKTRKVLTSNCLVKRKGNNKQPVTFNNPESPGSVNYSDVTVDISPVVMRTFTRSEFQPLDPSTGVPDGASRSQESPSLNVTESSPELDTMEYQETADASTPLSKADSSVQYSSFFGFISPLPSAFSPF